MSRLGAMPLSRRARVSSQLGDNAATEVAMGLDCLADKGEKGVVRAARAESQLVPSFGAGQEFSAAASDYVKNDWVTSGFGWVVGCMGRWAGIAGSQPAAFYFRTAPRLFYSRACCLSLLEVVLAAILWLVAAS
eukprot:1075931-Pleurochrysis_carterae.AAC.1